MQDIETIKLLECGSCIECTYICESPLKCKNNDCEYKDALKIAIKIIKAKDKTAKRLKEIEQKRNYRLYDSNFWEGFYLASEVFYGYFGEAETETPAAAGD